MTNVRTVKTAFGCGRDAGRALVPARLAIYRAARLGA